MTENNEYMPKFVDEGFTKKLREHLSSSLEKEAKNLLLEGKVPTKEISHAANVAILSGLFKGDYATIVLGLAGMIDAGRRKALVEALREDAVELWTELFGSYPRPWKQNANDETEPFHFVDEGVEKFKIAAKEVFETRIAELEETNCRRIAWNFAMAGVSSLSAGSITLPVLFAGIGNKIWNSGEEAVLQEYHEKAQEYWNKYLSEVENPYF